MRCPNLKELPLAASHKIGWPWTEGSLQLPDEMPNGKPWPKISIVTPNYNYSYFIEETIRSVLLQGYPNLEYIIIDDGSDDNSVEIVKKYEKWLAYWQKQTNYGQANAINKGIAKATGEIIGYLNSDDILMQRALAIVARKFLDKKVEWIAGRTINIDSQSNYLGIDRPRIHEGFRGWVAGLCHLSQPATFWSMKLGKKVGPFDERLYYTIDYDFFTRCSYVGYEPHCITNILAKNRVHPDSKSVKYAGTPIIVHDREMMGKFFFGLLKPEDRRWVLKNEEFQRRISDCRFSIKSGFKLRSIGKLLKIIVYSPWVLRERQLYGCIKFLFLHHIDKRD